MVAYKRAGMHTFLFCKQHVEDEDVEMCCAQSGCLIAVAWVCAEQKLNV